MSNKIPTAEEIIQKYDSSIKDNHLTRVAHAARELVKLHVEAALKAVYEKRHACKEAILNAYPKENIL